MKTIKQEENPTLEPLGEITVREAGRRGGHGTLQRKGVSFFKEIGEKGGMRTKELYAELLSEFGRKGGRPRQPTLTDSMGEKD